MLYLLEYRRFADPCAYRARERVHALDRSRFKRSGPALNALRQMPRHQAAPPSRATKPSLALWAWKFGSAAQARILHTSHLFCCTKNNIYFISIQKLVYVCYHAALLHFAEHGEHGVQALGFGNRGRRDELRVESGSRGLKCTMTKRSQMAHSE